MAKVKELKVEYVSLDEIKPYAGNAKLHPAEQIAQIQKSIEQFGMNDPIAVWKKGEVIEGHGRLIALKEMGEDKLKELGLERIPIIRLDNLTDKQRKAYALVHNKITMNSDFDVDLLAEELAGLDEFGMDDYGFEFLDDEEGDSVLGENPYTKKVKIPQYEPEGDMPDLSELVDTTKKEELIAEIMEATIPDEEKEFLYKAACRHDVFNYKKIAEYYAQAEPEMQRLMEKSALVIIDVDDAIANGYVKLTQTLEDLLMDSDSDAE